MDHRKARQKNLPSAEHNGGGPTRDRGSGGQAGGAISLWIYAWRSLLMFDKRSEIQFFLQALNPRPASRLVACPRTGCHPDGFHRLL